MLSCSHLTVIKNQVRLLDDVSFDLSEGSFTHLIGPNGAGKSTLIRAVSGLDSFSGQVTYRQQGIDMMSRHRLALIRSCLLQQPSAVFPVNSYQLIDNTFAAIGLTNWRDHADELIIGLNLSHLFEKSVTQLSGGELQRLHLLRVLLMMDTSLNPEAGLLLLDEPFNGLDIHHRLWLNGFLASLSEQGKTIVLCHHEINMVLAGEQSVLLLACGQVAGHGTVESVLSDEQLSLLFQVPGSRIKRSESGARFILGI